MTSVLTPDICVIGAGSAGLTVVAAARAFGVDVVLIEKGEMGGDCLNTGCVPSKALIAAAGHAHAVTAGANFGVHASVTKIDPAGVRGHVHGVIDAIAPHDSQARFEGLGATVIRAPARFTGPDTVEAGDHTIRARRFVIATGSRAFVPPVPGLDSVPYLTNETIFDLAEVPRHLAIIGGGPIGLELGQAYRRLGAEVSVIEAAKPLAKDDPELVALVLKRLADEGIAILEQTRVVAVRKTEDGVAVDIENEAGLRTIGASHLLVAAGRTANIDDLGLDAAGIGHDRRGIRTDRSLRTNNPKVYAIGDVVAGSFQFTHWAGYHAGLVVRAILFRLPVRENRDIVPWCTYTDPQIGAVGLSEGQARRRHGGRVKVLTAAFAGNDRAQTERETEGHLKLIVGPRGRILGAAVAGPQAGEIIGLLSLAVCRKMTVKDFAGTVFAYPTLCEIVKRAALTYYGDATANPWLRRVLAVLRRFG
ncbi:Mercuric reductase [Hartmannibacter diazotrophicus]|uniref:Mercuric reductase n=1 Tax=Hartmannibacter diazotrophicus TaxID=1482074 RepID=A0A2C9D1D2_9HYPH|nr:FAD-dependent oxidoreductase [Hartmannibacter diazotrophicus]SON54060.1 Mercuric reductase [Hartmannibacter diazotrophicus]